VEDTARIFVQTEKGAAGILEMTWSVGVPSKSYLEIYGKDGAILLDLQGLTYKYKTWNEWKRIDNKTTEKDGFSRQINHFIDSINGKDPTVTIPEDGLYVQKLISYAYTSNKKENEYAFA